MEPEHNGDARLGKANMIVAIAEAAREELNFCNVSIRENGLQHRGKETVIKFDNIVSALSHGSFFAGYSVWKKGCREVLYETSPILLLIALLCLLL